MKTTELQLTEREIKLLIKSIALVKTTGVSLLLEDKLYDAKDKLKK